MPQLTSESAESALNEIYARFNEKHNKEKLRSLVQECNSNSNPLAAKIQKFPAVISEMVSDIMSKYGYKQEEMMMGITQIQMHAMKNPAMQSKVGVIMQAFMGKLEEGEEGDAVENMEVEECD